MELRAPLSLGGEYYLTRVSVGRDPEDDAVHDCSGCDGYVYSDRFHLRATVVRGDDRSRYLYCSDDCLRGFLSVAA